MGSGGIFTQEFLITLRALVGVHHSIYPKLPPRDIFFESLVEESFKKIRQPYSRIETTTPNLPKHDLLVGDARLSLRPKQALEPAQITFRSPSYAPPSGTRGLPKP